MFAWFRRATFGAIGALLLVGAMAPPVTAAIPAAPDTWFKLPGLNAASGAQWVRALAYGTPPNVVYAGLEGGGVFRSVNGGATWSAFNDGFPNPLLTNTRALLTSGTGTTVYAGNDTGVWKSTGGAWQPLAQGPEADPAKPKKLNESVQALASVTGGPMLAGVFNGGVFRSDDDGATWTPPPVNNGMPATETIYGLTSTIPGTVYATGGTGVYLSLNNGSSWTRISDGIPSIASPITTWGYPQRPNILFTSTGSNGIYRSVNGGATWSEINDGLGAVRARGFQIFTGSQGAHLYAATENGLWHALNGNSVTSPAPRWREVTKDGLIESGSSNLIMWSLTAPAIPGAGALGLIAGTQSNGGYFLAFSPPDSPCPSTPDTSTDCPRINDTTPTVGQRLTAFNGKWTGTPIIDFAYQWEQCSGSSCTPIDGAEETTFVVPESAFEATPKLGFRVRVTATNPAPTFGLTRRFSTITSPTAANPANYPGSNQISAPSISVLDPGETTSPQVGDKMYAEYGLTPSAFTDGWFNPKAATSIAYRWLRCDGFGASCKEIPGATARTYTLTSADGTHDLRVRVTGTNPSGVAEATSGASYDVTSEAAQIAAPLPPETPGGAARSQAPSISGTAYVGETLAGSVGGWKDPTTDFLRRWVRCAADGGPPCSIINKVATVTPETDSTYVLRDEDRGSTVRFRVTADVNGDLTPDGTDNHLPNAVVVDTAATAVVTDRPVPVPLPAPGGGEGPNAGGGSGGGGSAGGGGGGGGASPADAVPPALASLRISKPTVVPGRSVPFKVAVSEPGTLRLVITTPTSGRKTGGACKPLTKKNRTKKRCTYQRTVATITQAANAGTVTIPFNGKVGKKKLAIGTYTATIVVTDAAGNPSKATSIRFKVVRR